MPVLANPRWERFAQCIVNGLAEAQDKFSQGRAYKAAGYNVTNANSQDAAASRLLRKVRPILDRVRELQYAAARRTNVTVATIIEELEEARDIATTEKQTATMVAATSAKAKILGLQIDRTETGKPGDFQSIGSSDELASRMLLDAGASIVTDDMKAQAILELERHSRVLAAIAAGQPSADAASRADKRRVGYPAYSTQSEA
jgi:hypothetical protein